MLKSASFSKYENEKKRRILNFAGPCHGSIYCAIVAKIGTVTLPNYGPCHVSGIFLPLRVKSLPLATIYEVKIPLRKWKKSLLQRNPAQMTSAYIGCLIEFYVSLTLFDTKMSFKILKFSNRPSISHFPEQSTLAFENISEQLCSRTLSNTHKPLLTTP
jgi:hypothetical protein